MQKVIQNFTIGFFDSSGTFSVYTKKDDTGRALKFHIADSGNDYTELLSDPSLTISLREVLPNGFNLPDVPVDRSGIDVDEMSVIVPITKEMVQMVGTALCELVFATINDNRVLSTTKFKLIIQEAFDKKEPETEVLFNTWTELYIAVSGITTEEEIRVANENTRISNENTRISNEADRQAAEEVREHMVGDQVKKAEGFAVGTENDVPVPSTSPYYHNNSKYYAENAQRYHDDTQTFAYDSEAWAIGKKNGIPVTSSDEQYMNNAKYYALQAQAVSGLFNGTTAEWEALSPSEKAHFGTVILTDD